MLAEIGAQSYMIIRVVGPARVLSVVRLLQVAPAGVDEGLFAGAGSVEADQSSVFDGRSVCWSVR